MKRKPLQVSVHAREPSVVELTVGDRVQLDRMTPSQHGYVVERHGHLLDPGVNTVALPPGHYFFKTLSDANLRVVTGGVSAGIAADNGKDDPPEHLTASNPLPSTMGDEVRGELPRLTME